MTRTARPDLRQDIQGIRGVAILLAVSWHAGAPVRGGFVSFDMFFVISGFVICGMLTRQHAREGRIALRPFYVRRFWRLIPAYALMITVTVVASAVVLSPVEMQTVVARTAIGGLLLHANYIVPLLSGSYFGPTAALNPFLHTWSLSLEEQVYVVFPAILIVGLVTARRTGRRCWLWLPLLAATCVSLAVAQLTGSGPLPYAPTALGGYYGPGSRFWEFGAGALLALWDNRARGATPALRETSRSFAGAATGVGLLAVSATLISSHQPYPSLVTLAPVTGMVLLIGSGGRSPAGRRHPIDRVLRSSLLTYLGDISYSWYLWHWPFICLARAAGAGVVLTSLAAVVSIVPAALSYRYVERPVVEKRASWFSPDARALAWRRARVVVMAPLTAAALMVGAVGANYGSPVVAEFAEASTPHLGHTMGCFERPAESACVLNPGPVRDGLVLWGDSNAEQYVEPLLRVAAAQGRRLTLVVDAGCPPLDAILAPDLSVVDPALPIDTKAAQQESDLCRADFLDTTAWLSRQAPSVVVLGFSALYDTGSGLDLVPASGASRQGTSGTDVIGGALTSVVSRLRADQHRVVVAEPIPLFLGSERWTASSCGLLVMLAGHCGAREPLTSEAAAEAPVRAAVEQVARQAGVSTFDPTPYLCPHGTCVTQRDGMVLYQDIRHLSVAASEALTPLWGSTVAAAARELPPRRPSSAVVGGGMRSTRSAPVGPPGLPTVPHGGATAAPPRPS